MASFSNTENSDVETRDALATHSVRFSTAQAVEIYDVSSKPTWPFINAVFDTFRMTFDDTEKSAAQDGQQTRRGTFLDIGCGPGSYTLQHLLPRLPPWCTKVVAVDNSEAMLEFARENNADPKIEYRTLDLSKDDDVLRFSVEHGPFQRVYSFITLHWLADQLQALKNIETLMAPRAECFLVFSYTMSVFDLFETMIRSSRWEKYSDLLQRCIPPTNGMHETGALRSYLAKLVSGTNLIPLSCEVVRSPMTIGCTKESAVDIFLLLNPVYPLLNDDEKAELREFTEGFIKSVKEGPSWDVKKREQSLLVIHAYKPEV